MLFDSYCHERTLGICYVKHAQLPFTASYRCFDQTEFYESGTLTYGTVIHLI